MSIGNYTYPSGTNVVMVASGGNGGSGLYGSGVSGTYITSGAGSNIGTYPYVATITHPPINLYAEEKITEEDFKNDLFKQIAENQNDITRIPPDTLKRLRDKILCQVENYINVHIINDPFNPDEKKIIAKLAIYP